MADFFAMGGYGTYVWSAYAIFFVVLVIDTVAPFLQKRRTLKELSNRMKRQSVKKSA